MESILYKTFSNNSRLGLLARICFKEKGKMVYELKTGFKIYKKRMGNELKNKILEYNGIDIGDLGTKKPSILNCPRCDLTNALDNKYCSKCSYPLTPKAFDQLKQNEEQRFVALENKLIQDMEDRDPTNTLKG